MPHAKVLDFLHAAHLQRKARDTGQVLSATHPSRSAFHGLLIAALIAAGFWATVALLIARWR